MLVLSLVLVLVVAVASASVAVAVVVVAPAIFLSLVVAKNRQIGGVFTFSLVTLEQKTQYIPMFFAPPKPKTTVFSMFFFASGSKNHGIYSVFWPAPSKNIPWLYAGDKAIGTDLPRPYQRLSSPLPFLSISTQSTLEWLSLSLPHRRQRSFPRVSSTERDRSANSIVYTGWISQ